MKFGVTVFGTNIDRAHIQEADGNKWGMFSWETQLNLYLDRYPFTAKINQTCDQFENNVVFNRLKWNER